MKLSKLYSNKPFHNATFFLKKGGLNVILGDSKGKQKGSNSHSLGKSKLAELLDFMLLKKHQHFFFYKKVNKDKFAGYEFYLEILLSNNKYVTIKRCIDKPTKIFFKLQEKRSIGYVFYDNFDKVPSSFEKAKSYLNELLNFDFCIKNQENYRRLVNYSLRTQGDYDPKMNTIFQLKKFARNKDKFWKPLLFNLLGFDGDVLKRKYELEEQIKENTKSIKNQERDFDIKTEEKDLLVGKIQHVTLEKKALENELQNLDFYKQDKTTINNLVGKIEHEISGLNTYLYNVEFDIKKLENAIRNDFSFDLKRVKRLFEEVNLHFPKQLARSYEQLQAFNQKITQERNAQIRETLQEKKSIEKELNVQLKVLNKKKEKYRAVIQDTSLFKKYSIYQKRLIELEKQAARFQLQLEAIEEMEQKREKIATLQQNELQKVKNQVKEIVDTTATCTLYMDIRLTFSKIVKRILHETAIITIKPNSNYNINFAPEFPNSAKDEGNTYYKILCVAFDLAILINYRNQSHFRFVYHDDVVGGDDNGIKTRLIEVVQEICEQHNIQYIFSTIKDNIPPSQNLMPSVVLSLHDKSAEGKLFKMSF